MKQEQQNVLETAIRRDCSNISGIVVQQDGVRVYERYWNGFSAGDCAHVFSVTKSVISALIGIALEQGCIRSIDQRVLDFFPYYTSKRGEKTIQRITLRDLLTMTAPYKYSSAPYTKYFSSEDWVKSALDLLGGKGQIGAFRYTPVIGPDIFSGILQAVTGKPILKFAAASLFAPLAISPKHSLSFSGKDEQMAWYQKGKYNGDWVCDPQGVNTAGWGLTLTTREMASIGQLYLDDGVQNGAQLIPAWWVRESTTPHSRWAEKNLGYGYLWWVIDDHSFAAVGDGGNVIYGNRMKRLVVSIASTFRPRVTDRIPFIQAQIEPLF